MFEVLNLIDKEGLSLFILGLYSGVLLSVMIYNIVAFNYSRELIYLLYSTLVFGTLLFKVFSDEIFTGVEISVILDISIFIIFITLTFLNFYYYKIRYKLYRLKMHTFAILISTLINLIVLTLGYIKIASILGHINVPLITFTIIGTPIYFLVIKGDYRFNTIWLLFAIGIAIYTLANMKVIPTNSFTSNIVMFTTIPFIIYMNSQISKNLKYAKERNIVIEKELEESHFRILQSRMNPHFLSNTLNIIQNQIIEDPGAARETISELSQNFSYVTETLEKELIKIEDELEFITNYLRIMKKRWPTTLTLSIDVDDKLLKFPIPPFTIQPLIENSFKHGLKDKYYKHLAIKFKCLTGSVVVEVLNTSDRSIDRIDYSRSLNNIIRRVNNYYDNCRIDFKRKNELIQCRLSFDY